MVSGWTYDRGHAGDGSHVALMIDCDADPFRRLQEQREGLSIAAAAAGLGMLATVGPSMVAFAALSMVASVGLRLVAPVDLHVVAFAAFVDTRRTCSDPEVAGRGDHSREDSR